jgi:hypothetical protein
VPTPASAGHPGRFFNIDTLEKLLKSFGILLSLPFIAQLSPSLFYDHERHQQGRSDGTKTLRNPGDKRRTT